MATAAPSWQATLAKILQLAAPVSAALAAPGATPATVIASLKQASSDLLSAVKDLDTVDDLVAAAQSLQAQHAQLAGQPSLTTDDLQRLGVLSGSAFVLSQHAMQQAATDEAILLYTVRQIVPWLQRLADLALVALGTV